jgi:hypothetical protein
MEYEHWTTCAGFPGRLRSLDRLNLDDYKLKYDEIFPTFRRNKYTIDFYLSSCVFPKEAKEFPFKLTTNAWDLACEKKQPTTGFSGTNDNKWLLPLSISQKDLLSQRHTNAFVLKTLILPENREVVDLTEEDYRLGARGLIRALMRMTPSVTVLLDVGAQVLDLSNRSFVEHWLEKSSSSSSAIQAAVYFDDRDEVRVVDRYGRTEAFASSVYRSRLQSCLVYLDEAHTRGTDFKFPPNTRAAVTLGPRIPKDKLVQGRHSARPATFMHG